MLDWLLSLKGFQPNWGDHILFLLLGVILPFRSTRAQKGLSSIRFTSNLRIRLFLANSLGLWAMAIIVLVYWWMMGRPLGGLGLGFQVRSSLLGWTAFGIFALLYLIDFAVVFATRSGMEKFENKLSGELGLLPRNRREYLYFIPLSLSAGVCEEIVFRGYFIAYWLGLTTPFQLGFWSPFIAIVLPAVIFGIVHQYQGNWAVVRIVLMAVLFGVCYLEFGVLWPLMALHFGIDLVGGVVGLWFPEAPEPEPFHDFTWEEE